MYKHLVIGKGEVGKAVAEIFHSPSIDKDEQYYSDIDVLHICFPYSKKFVKYAKEYIKRYNPKITIIHSTVAIGTTRKLGGKVVHSPVRGVHPNLADGIKTFTKYIGAVDKSIGEEVASVFRYYGVHNSLVCEPEESEAGKLLDTTYYGWNIIFEKYIDEFCKKHKLNRDIVYKHFNQTYNQGYIQLNKDHVVRPVLEHYEGKIGGHCVMPNCELLDFEPAKIIRKKNKHL